MSASLSMIAPGLDDNELQCFLLLAIHQVFSAKLHEKKSHEHQLHPIPLYYVMQSLVELETYDIVQCVL